MQNAVLLKAVADARRPVLLKRGFGNTAAELLHAAEYVLAGGNDDVILCERGIRTFEPGTRFTLDVGAVAWLKQRSRLPVIVDPSHAAGTAELVVPLALAGIAAGADGLIVEVHDSPAEAASDGDQALEMPAFEALMARLAPLAAGLGRRLDSNPTTSSSTRPVFAGAAKESA
jgi:3-deoxy-7-phosphoheptulonate synthase